MQVDISSKPANDCPHKAGHSGFTCNECGNTFRTPILARVLTGGNIQTYDACPRCMTKVRSAQVEESKVRRIGNVSKTSETAQPVSEGNKRCGHFFGYLGKRTKTAPIPEPCLICAKMVECLYG